MWDRIKAEKRQFFVYALLRVVLPTIAMVGLFMVLIIPGLALAGVYGAFEYGLHSAFADATGRTAVAGFLLQVFFGVVAFVFALLVSICLGGPLSTGIREYALLIYGGRYRALGDILYPQECTAADIRCPIGVIGDSAGTFRLPQCPKKRGGTETAPAAACTLNTGAFFMRWIAVLAGSVCGCWARLRPLRRLRRQRRFSPRRT